MHLCEDEPVLGVTHASNGTVRCVRYEGIDRFDLQWIVHFLNAIRLKSGSSIGIGQRNSERVKESDKHASCVRWYAYRFRVVLSG